MKKFLSVANRMWWQLVAFGFRLLYNEMAWTYDSVAYIVSLGQWRNWQRTALKHAKLAPGIRVLELAHGTGNLQMDLANLDIERFALDLSPSMGSIAQRKLQRNKKSAPLVRASGTDLPFADQSMDAVLSTFPTPFILEDKTLASVQRVLKPGGRFVVVMNGILTGGGVLRSTLEAAYRVTGQRAEWTRNLDDLFAAHGFSLKIITEEARYSVAQLLVAEKTSGERQPSVE